MESLGKKPSGRLSCIANNLGKYITFSRRPFKFIDSYQFMSSPLDILAKNLANDDLHKFRILKKHITDSNLFNLTIRKGVYPYDYLSDAGKFKEEKLPSKEDFYNKLDQEEISTEDYTHAQHVWENFRIKNLGEYHDLYLKTDVLLLADVFENFRDLILSSYKLDPAHYITAPGLSWDAMLKMTKVTLELLTDLDMHLMVERGIRGGISTITNKYGIANNKYQDKYDPSIPSKYITYWDANNLYGWSMSQSLPYSQFKWLTNNQIADFDVQNIADDNDIGYILDLDLSYPSLLHD